LDGLFWQGFGFNHTLGIEAFPNAESYKLGNRAGNITPARVFIRQTIGLGGDQEPVADDAFHLGGQQDISRLTLTVGQISVLDIFDQNSYAGDPTSQFMNWALTGNEAWDYPANSMGFITGFAAELNQPQWTLRYGFFQMPREQNGMAINKQYLDAWGTSTEFRACSSNSSLTAGWASWPGTARSVMGWRRLSKLTTERKSGKTSTPRGIISM
jgi:high affinity Mn2+ porin